ncbi:MAG: 2,3-bisphosphoglycerate-independent phosphoglycerate mutase [Bacilli bacterium]|nr:2,3-bisphosphoglycerate-independent phosphoglycerate mutase [Bacilli bacterium]
MKKVLLCIMDGVGIRESLKGNALKNANTKTLDKLMDEYPNILLEASGEYVGLPSGQMGNSEVGHSTIGSGRVIYQSLEKINKSIKDGDFYKNEELLNAINHAKVNNSKLHLIGLLSDGGIHSHINHLFAILDLCKKENFTNVYIHVITDGRDTAPDSGIEYIKLLRNKLETIGFGKIATICGRYYMMDRDNRFERVKLAYDMLTNGSGDKYNRPEEAWKNNQAKGITDEFINPSIINREGIIKDNDSIITFNYRPDRLRELYAALTNKDYECFERKILNNIKVVTMMPVSDEVICTNAFKLENIDNVLGTVISNNNMSQLRIAETEKYAHVTYFFDGGKELELNNCKKILIPSPKVNTYDLKPEMSAKRITETLLNELKETKYDLIVLNYANGDMVGHTGVYEKGIIAVETVDICIEKLINNIDLSEYTIIITADHGNCEEMINDDDTINTAHTTNVVPFIVLDKNIRLKENKVGSLSDIAPTILNIMNLNIPKEMTGDVLINE